MALRPIESISGLFDTDEGKLVGIFPTGTNDVSYLPTSEKRVSGDPVAAVVDPFTGRVRNSAGSVDLGSNKFACVTNIDALRPFAAMLRGAAFGEVVFAASGDSLTQFGGSTENQILETRAELENYTARLRAKLNRHIGSPDGGQWIPASPVVSDSRVSSAGQVDMFTGWGIISAYSDTSGASVKRPHAALQTAGGSITYSFKGRFINLLTWEDTTNNYLGTWNYSVDSGPATNVIALGQPDKYRITRIDCGSVGDHTVKVSWVSGSSLHIGGYTSNGSGVSSLRFGFGGMRAQDYASAQERELRATFKTLPVSMHIIRFSHNDWESQARAGYTTPEYFAQKLGELVNAALSNPSVKTVLLLCDPISSIPDSFQHKYVEYINAAKSIAVGRVSYIDLRVATNWLWQSGQDLGLYIDFVHRSASGHDVDAEVIASILTDSSLLEI